jgi:5-methylcytosine-specific restriction endonuclease McrA
MIEPKSKAKSKTKTAKKRDYKKEYREYHGKPEQIKRRDMRNAARRKMEKEGRVRKGDGKEVDHKVPLSKGGSNSRRNLRIVSRTTNRRKGNKR